MAKEEEISGQIAAKFPFLAGQVKIQRARRLWADVPADKFMELFSCLAREMGFSALCTITGLDAGDFFAFIYHLAKDDGIVLNLKTKIPKSDGHWKSIGEIFPVGIFYEREIADLLGVKFDDLPPGPRYPLPDNWPEGQYPLRKDWQGLPVTAPAKGEAPGE